MSRPVGKHAAISPDRLIEMMIDPSEPESAIQIIKKSGLSPATITLWKRKIPGFEKMYKQAMRKMKTKVEDAKPRPRIRKTGWEQPFLDIYSKTGRFHQSCQDAGVHYKTVESRKDPEATTYSPDFHERFKEAERAIKTLLVDVAHKRAIEGESDGMIKFLLATHLPETYGTKVTNTNIIEAKIEFRVVEENARKFLEEVLPELDGEFVDTTERPTLLLQAVREDEEYEPTGHNWSETMVMQERPLLPASV